MSDHLDTYIARTARDLDQCAQVFAKYKIGKLSPDVEAWLIEARADFAPRPDDVGQNDG